MCKRNLQNSTVTKKDPKIMTKRLAIQGKEHRLMP